MKNKEEGGSDKKQKKDKTKNSFENKLKKEIDAELKESMGDVDPKTIAKNVKIIYLLYFLKD